MKYSRQRTEADKVRGLGGGVSLLEMHCIFGYSSDDMLEHGHHTIPSGEDVMSCMFQRPVLLLRREN